MPGIDTQIDQRMALGPQALQQRYAQTQQLVDLLALQKLSKDKADAARAIEASMQNNPASVKDQLEQQLMGAQRQEVSRDIQSMLPGVQQQGRQMAQQRRPMPQQMAQQRPPMPQQRPPMPQQRPPMPQQMAQQMAQQRPPIPQGQGGIPQLASPNMSRMAGGGIVSFEEGGDVDAANEYIRLSEKLKNPNISPEAAQAINMTLEDMKRQAQDESRFMLEIERARGFDPAAEYEQSMQSQGGMYGGGRVKGYAGPDGSEVEKDSEELPPEILALLTSMQPEGGEPTEVNDVDRSNMIRNPVLRTAYRVTSSPEAEAVDKYLKRVPEELRKVGDKIDAAYEDPRIPFSPGLLGILERTGALMEPGMQQMAPEFTRIVSDRSDKPWQQSVSDARKAVLDLYKGAISAGARAVGTVAEGVGRNTVVPAGEFMGALTGITEPGEVEQGYETLMDDLKNNPQRVMGLLGGNGESGTPTATAPATAPEQDIVDAMIGEGITAPESVPTGREAFLGAEDAARQDRVDQQIAEGGGKREIDMDALSTFLLGMGGGTSVAGALGGGGRAVQAERQRLEGLEAEESRFAREIASKEGIAKQQLDMFKDELAFKRDQLATVEEKTKFDIAKDMFDQTAQTELARWVESENGWFSFAPNRQEQDEHLMEYFNKLLKQQGLASLPIGATEQNGLTPEQARANEILGI